MCWLFVIYITPLPCKAACVPVALSPLWAHIRTPVSRPLSLTPVCPPLRLSSPLYLLLSFFFFFCGRQTDALLFAMAFDPPPASPPRALLSFAEETGQESDTDYETLPQVGVGSHSALLPSLCVSVDSYVAPLTSWCKSVDSHGAPLPSLCVHATSRTSINGLASSTRTLKEFAIPRTGLGCPLPSSFPCVICVVVVLTAQIDFAPTMAALLGVPIPYARCAG